MALQKNTKPLQAEDMVFELLAELGNLYLELGKYDEAIDKLKMLVEMEENNASGLLNLSKAYLKKEKYDDEALGIYERALAKNPGDPELVSVVAKLYLERKRSDSEALKIYAKYLRKQDDEKFAVLANDILQVLCGQEDHAHAHSFINRFRDKESRFRDLVAFYLKKVWETGQFDSGEELLNSLIKEDQNNLWRQLYLTNLWKKSISSPDNAHITSSDLERFKSLIAERQIFDTLSEAYQFLIVNRLFQRFPIKADESSRPSIEEYELFISGDTFSNIWDLGLNKREISGANLGFDDHILFKKMRPVVELKENELIESIEEISRQSNCLLVLRCDPGNFPVIKKALKSIFDSNGSEKLIIQAFEARDGFIAFADNIDKLMQVAKKLAKKQEQLNEKNNGDRSALEIVINSISLVKDKHSKYLFDDLEVALSLFARNDAFLLPERINLTGVNSSTQIFITESVKNILSEKNELTYLPARFKLKHPVNEELIEIFKINIHDALDKIENGALKTIGKFKVNQELHQNQIFSSFKAVDSMLERLVVLKVLKPGFEINDDPELTKKVFADEAKKLGQLTHPNVALIYEIGEDHHLQYIAREYVDGTPLSKLIPQNSDADWKKAVKLGIELAEILTTIHKKKMIHGRLKPSNIFVLEKMELKLTDFHVAGFGLPVRDLDNIPLRSLTYSAPELLDIYEPTVQTDVYSLGIILYEQLTGHNPFLNGTRDTVLNNILTRMPDPVQRINSSAPKALNEIIFKMLEKAPVNRYSDMKTLVKDLKNIV